MPDITMCSNKTCSLKEKCYRFMAKPDMRQSFAWFTPAGSSCANFVALQPSDLLKEKR